jgi:hypothetical protein
MPADCGADHPVSDLDRGDRDSFRQECDSFSAEVDLRIVRGVDEIHLPSVAIKPVERDSTSRACRAVCGTGIKSLTWSYHSTHAPDDARCFHVSPFFYREDL